MRTLVVGAGAVGGYFGGRLIAAGRDVRFLVRQRRASQLASDGLSIRSRFGDVHIAAPATVLASELDRAGPFDLVLLSCKAYDLDDAIAAFAPAVGPSTSVLPLLNGMRHLERLDEAFGASRVLGGLCFVAATLDPQGRIVHLNEIHTLAFGARDSGTEQKAAALLGSLNGAGFEARRSDAIQREMWEKWVMLAALAAATCLMRASIGDIVTANGPELPLALLEECRAIAERAGASISKPFLDRCRADATAPGSRMTASMLRDIEQNGRTEADHVLGDLIARAGDVPHPLLRLAHEHLRAYETRRLRTRGPD